MAFTTCRSRDAARPALCFSLLPGTRGWGAGMYRLKVEEVKVESSWWSSASSNQLATF